MNTPGEPKTILVCAGQVCLVALASVRLLLTPLGAAEALPSIGSQTAPPLNMPTNVATTTKEDAPTAVDPALLHSREPLSSTNLLPNPETSHEQLDQLAALEAKLVLARQQRHDKEFQQAEKNLVDLLQSDAPVEFKRSALLEMALLAQDAKQPARAQQVFNQYLHQFQGDPSTPEVLLRQGLLYREMGAPVLALSKFYAVMTSALNLKLDKLGYYRRLVLQAQTEIADTYYLQGKFVEAADFFNRLLKLDNPELNQAQVLYKLVRSQYYAGRYPETLGQAELFIGRYPESNQVTDVRFLLADALKRLGRREEATKQVLILLQTQQNNAAKDPEGWLYWQQRTGNEIANQLYQEGDYLNALQIYLHLVEMNSAPEWQLPVCYQVAIIYERMKQPEKASAMYTRIMDRQKDLGTNLPPASLSTVLDMAKWRKNHLSWQTQAEYNEEQLTRAMVPYLQPATSKP